MVIDSVTSMPLGHDNVAIAAGRRRLNRLEGLLGFLLGDSPRFREPP